LHERIVARGHRFADLSLEALRIGFLELLNERIRLLLCPAAGGVARMSSTASRIAFGTSWASAHQSLASFQRPRCQLRYAPTRHEQDAGSPRAAHRACPAQDRAERGQVTRERLRFVAFGVGRYLPLVKRRSLGEEPEEIALRDGPIVVATVAWVVTSAVILAVRRR
jgi:hypothetical protein